MAKKLKDLSIELAPITKDYLNLLITNADQYVPDFKYMRKVGALGMVRIKFSDLLEKQLKSLGYKGIKTINDYGGYDIVVLDADSSMILVKANFNRTYSKINIIK